MTYEPPITDYDYIVENCTCAFCGCNCDDLDYLVKNNHVVAVRHACRLGASKIMEDMDQRLIVPMIRHLRTLCGAKCRRPDRTLL